MAKTETQAEKVEQLLKNNKCESFTKDGIRKQTGIQTQNIAAILTKLKKAGKANNENGRWGWLKSDVARGPVTDLTKLTTIAGKIPVPKGVVLVGNCPSVRITDMSLCPECGKDHDAHLIIEFGMDVKVGDLPALLKTIETVDGCDTGRWAMALEPVKKAK